MLRTFNDAREMHVATTPTRGTRTMDVISEPTTAPTRSQPYREPATLESRSVVERTTAADRGNCAPTIIPERALSVRRAIFEMKAVPGMLERIRSGWISMANPTQNAMIPIST